MPLLLVVGDTIGGIFNKRGDANAAFVAVSKPSILFCRFIDMYMYGSTMPGINTSSPNIGNIYITPGFSTKYVNNPTALYQYKGILYSLGVITLLLLWRRSFI